MRAEFVAAAAGALLLVRELELGTERRALELSSLRVQLDQGGAAGEFLATLERDLRALAESARRALAHVEGISVAELADDFARRP